VAQSQQVLLHKNNNCAIGSSCSLTVDVLAAVATRQHHAHPAGVAADAGVVKSTKMNRTIVVRRDYLHYIKKYAR
jgi:hypothetical protein